MKPTGTGETLRCISPSSDVASSSVWLGAGQKAYEASRPETVSTPSESMLTLQAQRFARALMVGELAKVGVDSQYANTAIPNVVPSNTSLLSNMRAARSMSAFELVDAVRTGGTWDYKRNQQSENESFGNFNFGFAARAWVAMFFADGIPDGLDEVLRNAAQRGAGAYQMLSNPSEEWGWFLGSFPYGDDPRDQQQIMWGWDFEKELDSPQFDTDDGDASLP